MCIRDSTYAPLIAETTRTLGETHAGTRDMLRQAANVDMDLGEEARAEQRYRCLLYTSRCV